MQEVSFTMGFIMCSILQNKEDRVFAEGQVEERVRNKGIEEVFHLKLMKLVWGNDYFSVCFCMAMGWGRKEWAVCRQILELEQELESRVVKDGKSAEFCHPGGARRFVDVRRHRRRR